MSASTEQPGPRPVPEGVAPVVESLLHLLPTAAAVFDADGEALFAEEAAPICRFLANPPEGRPDVCHRDCRALASEALSSRGRVHGACTAGLNRVAEPIVDPASGRSSGVLVAATSGPPIDDEHWATVAERYERDFDELLRVVRSSPRLGLAEWECIERVEVATSVLTRVVAHEEPAVRSVRPAVAPRTVSARRQLAQLVLELARAANEAIDESDLLAHAGRRVREIAGFRAAWHVPVDGDPIESPEAPAALGLLGRHPDHPARPSEAPRHSTYHARLESWPEADALAAAGIERLHVVPVGDADRVAALLFFAADARDEAPATIARRAALLDDLLPILGAHVTRARSLARERDHAHRLDAVHRAAARCCASRDARSVLDGIVDVLVDAIRFGRAGVVLHDETTGRLVGAASRSTEGRDRIARIEGPIEDFPVAIEAAHAGRPIAVHGTRQASVPEEHRRFFGVTDFVLAPLIAHGRLIGFLVADNGGTPFEATSGDLDLVGVLAHFGASALALARSHDEAVTLEAGHEAVRAVAVALAAGEPPDGALLSAAGGLPGVRTASLWRDDALPVRARDGEDGVAFVVSGSDPFSTALRREGCGHAWLAPVPGTERHLVLGLGAAPTGTALGTATRSLVIASRVATPRNSSRTANAPRESRSPARAEDATGRGTSLSEAVDVALGLSLAAAPRDLDLVRVVASVPSVAVESESLRRAIQALLDPPIATSKPGSRVLVATGLTESGDSAFVRVEGPASDAPRAGNDALTGFNVESEVSGPGRRVDLLRVPLAAAAPGPRGSADGDARRVLVVDDDEDARRVVAELLRSWGHAVTLATDGEEALTSLAATPVDAIVADLVMPGMGGWELARRVSRFDRPPPVLLLTGWSLDLDEAEVHRRGVRIVLEKPAQPDRLRREVALAMGDVAP